eukprot:TCONS_00031160-protein
MSNNVFDKQKVQSLKSIDHSKKGSFDAPIHDLIVFINTQPNFFTTSSCSGRLHIFREGENKKKGCKWLLSSHDPVPTENVINVLEQAGDLTGAIFKYESFILHVQCRTLEHAQTLLKVALECGYRNSGLVIGKKKKIMLAVRSTHGLEVPLAFDETTRVPKEYLEKLVVLANGKLEENFAKIDKFFNALKDALKEEDT